MRQAQAMQVMMSGEHVFLTGPPGAGKTYVLRQFIEAAKGAGKRVAVTASTGIAASHLGGTTIHSWSGLGILDQLSDHDLERLGNADRLIKRYNSTDILIIDEISMLHGYRLDMVNELAKRLRASDKPFGGMQVILVGDLFQLPPVNRSRQADEFVHTSRTWQELQPKICYLTEQHRQASHDALLELLVAMRSGDIEEYHSHLLQERLGREPDANTVVTRLYTHNIDVDSINQKHLQALDTDVRSYKMETKGAEAKIEQLSKTLLAPPVLQLKIGAEVMFVANNYAEGFVNGTRGTVVDFEYGLPVVRLQSGKEQRVDLHTWSLTEDGRVRAEISQIPLRLAWAITIHKSQGMSLDAAIVDLSRAFTPGMGYVALSRVRSLEGLYVTGMNNAALQMHPTIGEFDQLLSANSKDLAELTEDYVTPTVEAAVANSPNEALHEQLRVWRSGRAAKDRVQPFMVAHNVTLETLAAVQPSSRQQLLGITGLGPKKIELYGDEILAVITAHLDS
jgi:ATP-dependent DNA helicase PIF1